MKFTDAEERALHLLAKNGPLMPGRDRFAAWKAAGLIRALERLERKGLVESEVGDDGPQFTLTDMGRADAS